MMKLKLLLPFFFLMMSSFAVSAAAPVQLNETHLNPIGLFTSYFRESGEKLSLDEAVDAFDSGKFSAGHQSVLNLGVGSGPVWIHFSVENTTKKLLRQRLSIETSWLDDVKIYIRHDGEIDSAFYMGDTKNFSERPIDSRFFALDHNFSPGLSNVFIRVETPDTMVLPFYLMSPEQAIGQERFQDYSYGFLYGFLFALLIYNAMLYLGLKDARYLFYSIYLGMFVLMNISYTGHGFQWLWPNNPYLEQWSIPIFMALYGASGLLFALVFLDIRKHHPRLCRAMPWFLGLVAFLMFLAVVFEERYIALVLAFVFVFLFIGLMVLLGLITLKAEEKYSSYFLLATFTAMTGALITTLANWGVIPFNNWTFRAVEIGMMLDAGLLALALTYQFRLSQEAARQAEKMAMLDPLTNINNRRAFYDKSIPVWNVAQRNNRDLSLVMFDLDHFKYINDKYGHACGDEVLVSIAGLLKVFSRKQDVVARWGGEEFILLLPETGCRDATLIAERLRADIEALRLQHEGHEIRFTASFGVAQCKAQHQSLDVLISAADNCLYQAKEAGRNRVAHSEADTAWQVISP